MSVSRKSLLNPNKRHHDLLDHFDKSSYFILFISVFCSILTTDQIINILLNPGVQERTHIFAYTTLLYIPTFYLFLIKAPFTINKSINDTFLLKICLVWFYFIICRILQSLITDSTLNLYELFSQLLFFYIGYFLAKTLNKEKWPLFLILIFSISTVIIIGFCYSVYSQNTYSVLGLMYIINLRPQHEYNLIQSTEMSNYCAQVFIVGYVLFMRRELLINFKKYFWLLTITLFMLLLFIGYLFSVATLISIILISLIFLFKKRPIITLMIITTIFALLIYLNEWGQFFQDLYSYKSSATDRKVGYLMLMDIIHQNPFWGIGRGGKFFDLYGLYPHNNFLGIWAEGGIFLLLFYSGLLILFIGVFIRARKYFLDNQDRLIFDISACIIFFWHFKGLVEDTWNNPNLYIWTGIMTGIYSKYKTLSYYRTANSKVQISI
jgi:hypothetical protein